MERSGERQTKKEIKERERRGRGDKETGKKQVQNG